MCEVPTRCSVEEGISRDMDWVYEMIYRYFGRETQIMKLGEEAVELADAIFKYKKDPETFEHVLEELADVYVVGRQILLFSDRGLFDEIVKKKLYRTMERTK